VKDFDLLLDRGTSDRRRLQSIAQRLVIEQDHAAGPISCAVPVVNQGMVFHGLRLKA